MSRLHLFFPENDLALARDLERYTPPPAAARLRRSGEALPLWYGDNGDRFVATGINARWLDSMRDSFGIDIDVFDYRPEAYEAAPWGWSRASRREYLNLGFTPSALPDDSALEAMRALSNRRTAAKIRRRLGELLPDARLMPAARECATPDEVARCVDEFGKVVVKLPWSSSGRGLMIVDAKTLPGQTSAIVGMTGRQGAVMVEPWLSRRSDFALLYRMEGGRARYCGLSLFETTDSGSYSGNILAPQEEIGSRLRAECDAATFDALPAALGAVLSEIIGTAYSGPLGVDMMSVCDSDNVAIAEMNLRNTMGHVALALYGRHIAPGAHGHFLVLPRENAPEAPEVIVTDGRLAGGSLDLLPPGTDFVFRAELSDT